MEEKPLDTKSNIGYNTSNDEYELIDLSNVAPINDVECTHERLRPDPKDKIGDAIYYGCENPKCGRGWYIRPMK